MKSRGRNARAAESGFRTVENRGTKATVRLLIFCVVLLRPGPVAALLFPPFVSGDPVSVADLETLTALTETFLDGCRQREELVPDGTFDTLLQLCRDLSAPDTPLELDALRRRRLELRLNEVEILLFWGIDGYSDDRETVRTAWRLLESCEQDMNSPTFPEDKLLAGRALYLHATLLMAESWPLSHLPRFEEALSILERARKMLADYPKAEIQVMHAIGRACNSLAFAEGSEERYEEFLQRAEDIFQEALTRSAGQDDYMRTLLTAQLGNTLNNAGSSLEAVTLLKEALARVDPNDEPNRFLTLHLDIAQVLVGCYMETGDAVDLKRAEMATDRAFLVSSSLRPTRLAPHVRFNLAMVLSTLAEDLDDADRNIQAVTELEAVLDIWTFERDAGLHLMATDTICRLLDFQESLTRDIRPVERAIDRIRITVSRFEADPDVSRVHSENLSALYARCSNLYFKRALYETGDRQREAWQLSVEAEERAQSILKPGKKIR